MRGILIPAGPFKAPSCDWKISTGFRAWRKCRKRPSPARCAVSAVHRVHRKAGREVVVETELVLLATGQAPWTWRLPVSSAHDIQCSLDGERIPLPIAAGGQLGNVSFESPGRHVFLVRRSFAIRNEPRREVLSFAVNAVASARVVVDPPAKGQAVPVLAAAGGTRLQPDGGLAGQLGPAERIELAWAEAGNESEPKQAGGSVEGVVLWDIHPAGDRVRAKLTYGAQSSVRLAHAAGLILRSVRILGSSGFVWCENTGTSEWTLHFDPPLDPGGTVEIDCWMPISDSTGMSVPAQARTGPPGPGSRQLPAIIPVGAERYSGLLAAPAGRMDRSPRCRYGQ